MVRTRDPQEQTTDAAAERVQELVDELRSVGCRVEFRERMHEKVLILDGSLLWHGSLNLLANKGPTDPMMRLTDPVACERVGRVIERARKERAAWNPRTTGAGKAGGAGRATEAGTHAGGAVVSGVDRASGTAAPCPLPPSRGVLRPQ